MGNESLREKVFAGFFWKFGERITAQLVTLLVSIILARILDPSDYGAISLIMIFITIANVFVSHGLGSALIQKEDADNIDFSSVLYFNIFISIVLYIILFICAPYIALYFNQPILKDTLRVLGIRIIVASVNSIQHAYVSRHMLFKRFFWSTLFGTVVSGIVGIIMAYRGFGVWALVAQYLTNTCTDTLVLWVTVKWRPVFEYSWKKTKSLISFGWKLLVSGLIDVGYTQLRSFVIGKRYSPSDLAYYNQGEKYPSIIVSNINASISSVVFPAMSKAQSDISHVKSMTRRSIQISSFLMWPLMTLLFVVSEPLVRVLLTDKWLPCVPYIQVFCISYGFWPIHTSNLQAINAMGRSDVFLKLEVVKKVIGIILMFIAIPYGPFLIAISMLASNLISTVVNSFPNRKFLNYGFIAQLVDILPAIVLSAIMGGIIHLFKFIIPNNFILIATQVVFGILIYILLSKISNLSGYKYLKGFILEHKHRKGKPDT